MQNKKLWFAGVLVLFCSLFLVAPAYALNPAETLIYNSISSASMIQTTWDLMTGTVGPAGDRIYNNRTGGTPNGDLACATAVTDFTSWGLDAVETWDNPTVLNNVWYLKNWDITTDAYTFLRWGNWPCRNSPAGDATGLLAYVGAGTSASNYTSYPGGVAGKIVLCDNTSASSPYNLAKTYGAIGLVNIGSKGSYTPDVPYPGSTEPWTLHPYSSEVVTPGSITYNAANTMPAATVSYVDGQALKAILATTPVTMHLKVDAEFRSNVHSKSVFATINGTDTSKYYLLYGHLNADSYGPGCDDTASGEACIMEIAKVIQGLINQGKIQRPHYSIKFMLVGSETQDSRAWIATLSAEQKAQIIGSQNFDQAGYGIQSDLNVIESSTTADCLNELRVCKTLLADYPAMDPYFQFIDYEGGSDHDGFITAGIPTCYIWTDWTYRQSANANPPEFGGTKVWIAGNFYYHTSADVMETTVLREPFNEVNIAHIGALLAARMVGVAPLQGSITSPTGGTFVQGSAQTINWSLSNAVPNGSFEIWLKNTVAPFNWVHVTPAASPVAAVPGQLAYSYNWTVTQAPGIYTIWAYWDQPGGGRGLSMSSAGPITISSAAISAVAPASGTFTVGDVSSVTWNVATPVSTGSFRVWLHNTVAPFNYVRVTPAGSPVLPVAGTAYSAPWSVTQAPATYKLEVWYYSNAAGTALVSKGISTGSITILPKITPTITAPTSGSLPRGGSTSVSWTLNRAASTGSFKVWLKSAGGIWSQVTLSPVAAAPGFTSYTLPWFITQPAGTYTLYVYYYFVNNVGTAMTTTASAGPITIF